MGCGLKASAKKYRLLVCMVLAVVVFAGAAAGCSRNATADTSRLGRDDDEVSDAGSDNRGRAEAGVDSAVADAGERDAQGSAPREQTGMSDSSAGSGGEGEAGYVQDPTQATCGNGVLDDDEQCDDGNSDDGDGCESDCSPTYPDDDANTESADGCASDCSLEACGNGVLDAYEDCDDGDSDDADGCDSDCEFTCSVPGEDCPADVIGDCRLPACVANANGRVCGEQAEPDGTGCDNQQGAPGDYCYSGTCRDPVCGDRVRGPLQECDHQGEINGIGCSAQCLLQCPADMVRIPSDSGLGVESAFCMDRYEASRQDADAADQGEDQSIALSQAGVLPWYVNSMSQSALDTFQKACAAAGKHLCTREQWHSACTGPDRNTYFFGNAWNASACNSVDTHCQQCCDVLSLSECPTGANCGYNSLLTSEPGYLPETCFITEPYGLDTCHVCFHVMPTGSFPQCKKSLGLYDVNGNVWEVVPAPETDVDERGYQVRGGAFNCGNAAKRFQCTFDATWSRLYAGFRCCAELD